MCLPWLSLQEDPSLSCSVVEQPCQQAPSPAVTLRGHFPAALLRASQHGPQVKLDDTCHTAAHLWLSRWLKLREHKARGTDEAGKVPACSASFLPACSSFHMRNSGPDHPERLYSNQRARGIYGITSG